VLLFPPGGAVGVSSAGRPVSFSFLPSRTAKTLSLLRTLGSHGPREVAGGMNTAVYMWQAETVQHTPVDEGLLRASWTVSLASPDRQGSKLQAMLGSNVPYACVFDPKTKVATEQGSKRIADVVVGDRVLTQCGDFRDVVNTTRFPASEKPELVTISCPWRKGKDHRLTITADHKVLVFREGRNKWVHAAEVTTADSVFVRKKRSPRAGSSSMTPCECCGTPMREATRKRFCSADCYTQFKRSTGNPHRGAKRSEDSRRRMSRAAKARLEANPELHPSRLCAANGGATSYEQAVSGWLKARGIPFFVQWPIGPKIVDFFLPTCAAVIEADGAYWHQDQSVDIQRDATLKEVAPELDVIHLHFFDERFSPDLIYNPLDGVYYVSCNPGPASFVDPREFDARPVTSVVPWTFQSRGDRPAMLYDLEVDGVHSFVASGIVVSNTYIEFGTKWIAGGRVLNWSEGQPPILDWTAKQEAIDRIGGLHGAAKKAHEERLARLEAEGVDRTEFMPPMRGSWAIVEQRVQEHIRARVRALVKQQVRKAGTG
jgi:hypothetical protein